MIPTRHPSGDIEYTGGREAKGGDGLWMEGTQRKPNGPDGVFLSWRVSGQKEWYYEECFTGRLGMVKLKDTTSGLGNMDVSGDLCKGNSSREVETTSRLERKKGE